jgi:hypothetical protein
MPLEVDALRRDFTMNALYRNVVTGEIHDPLGGVAAIEDREITTTHPSSFRDDPLRTLRALRFVSQLGFDLDDDTYGQMFVHAKAVNGGLTDKGVSGTAFDELCKILMGRHVAKALRLARDSRVLESLLPELAPMLGHDPQNSHHAFSTDEHTFVALDAAAGFGLPLRVRLALLFHDAGKPLVEWVGKDGMKHYFESKDQPGSIDHQEASAGLWLAVAERLNVPRSLRRDVETLIRRHMVPLTLRLKPAKVRKWRCELGDDLLADLLRHRLCDVMAKGVIDYEAMRAVNRMEGIREDAVRDGVPVTVRDLPVSGGDIAAMGVSGPRIGEIQRQLLHEAVSQPSNNTRERLYMRALKLAA